MTALTHTDPDDDAAVEAVARDYFAAWFAGDAALMQRVLHPGLVKRSPDDGGLYEDTAATMVVKTEQARGSKWDPALRTIDVDVVHRHGDIATVVVTGPIYVEYLHLVRMDGRWRIANALYADA